jgi:carboxyl-terminal processing protease
MRRNTIRIIGFVLVVVVLGLATFVTFFSSSRGGLELEPEAERTDPGYDPGRGPEDLGTLRAFYKTVNLVQKHYIDPSRIDSREMLVAAMRAVQMQVSEVLVREDGDDLIVRLGATEKRFAVADVATPWILLQRAREMFEFVRAGVSALDVDFQEVEYGAINGMLRTLDPHSALLPPDVYRDMKDKTQGQFGGLGIVISIRDGVLTIISPLDGTPADLAGLQAGDQIVKIGEVSTVSMPLNDAVNLLRGKPGTTVRIYILRKGWEEARPFDVVRAIIEVRSVESHMLQSRIGYVRVKDFQGNTRADLIQQLGELERKGIRGLVLDLRNNPGGLLEAAIQVADMFVKSGVIVTTAGQGPAQRDIRRAEDDRNEPAYPVVVLVNSGSASASEIVAGALKNHGRALLVGQRTFGKGSVQVLYDYHDGSALKLTTAQYLTPGDISIQGVGVVPDVELLPMRADKEMLDLKVDAGYRESDLDHHFEDVGAAVTEGLPATSLRYLWIPPKKKPKPKDAGSGKPADDGEGEAWTAEPVEEEQQKFKPDFEIDLARDLALEMAAGQMSAVDPTQLAHVLGRRSDKEQQRLALALRKMGIDWRTGAAAEPARTEVSVQLGEDRPIKAGERAKISVTLTNHGPGTLHQLLATSRSDFRPLEDKELAFGRVGPGQTVAREFEFKVPKDALGRMDDVMFSFEESGGRVVPSAGLRFEVEALPEPHFAYGVQMVDIDGGNGDGGLQIGEKVKLLVDIDNVGRGKSLSTYATLKSLSGNKVFLIKGREQIGEMPAGERRQAVFEFELKPGFAEPAARFELAVMDVDLRVYAIEKLKIPIAAPRAVKVLPLAAMASPTEAPVRGAPNPDAPVIATLIPGAITEADAESGTYLRVRIGEQRFGWVEAAALEPASGPPAEATAELAINSPPGLVIEEVARVVRQPAIRIRGRAHDESRVRDVYVFVGEDKVFFKPNTDSARPGVLEFEAELPLEKGLNYITVVAEETADLDTRQVFAVRRDRLDGMGFVASRMLNGKPEALGVMTALPQPIGP